MRRLTKFEKKSFILKNVKKCFSKRFEVQKYPTNEKMPRQPRPCFFFSFYPDILNFIFFFFSFMIHIFLIFVLSKIIVFPFFSLIEKQHPTLTNLVAILATLVIILMMLVTILAIQMTILDQA